MPTKQILIVDDEKSITRALSSLFQQAGYGIITAQSGSEALKLLSGAIDLIILDVLMPGLDGYEVCRRVRGLDIYIPILMLTARDTVSDKVLGLEIGADLYVTKPFEPTELLAQVRAFFRTLERKTSQAASGYWHSGPLQVWEEQRRASLAGQPVELTPLEFKLLLTLMHHAGKVLGRETLLHDVWGHDYLGDSRTVDVHIQRLRSKIEADPLHPQLIETVRGFGYRLTTVAE